MQQTVSKRYLSRRQLKNVNLIIIVFVILIITMCLVLTPIVISIKKRPKKIFDEKKFYLVYSHKNLKQNEVKKHQDIIKKLGGSGDIYHHKDYYYLITSLYLDKSDADSVKNNIKTNFKDAGVLQITIKKISKNKQIIFFDNPVLLNFIKFQSELLEKISNYQILYLSGEIQSREIISSLLEKKLELERIITETEKLNNDIKKNNNQNDKNSKSSTINAEKISAVTNDCLLAQKLYLLYFNNFLNVFFESLKKDSLLCELACNIALVYYDFCNNL